MTYKETIDFLYSQLPVYHRIGKAAYKADLNNIRALDTYFGHPHLKFKSVHIAGTNGKGSVSHMVASVFQEAGYKTGLYTSPHLKDYRERMKINGVMIPEDEVISFVEKHIGIIGSVKPSFFEMSVAMAFDFFSREKVDIAVIEVGLGGRLDSTNIISPILSVITNIGHDHMDLLGNTLSEVAAEKAGIIKNNVPVIVGEKKIETKEIFIAGAREKNSHLSFASDSYDCTLHAFDYNHGTRNFSLHNLKEGSERTGISPLGGDYQSQNIPVVAASADFLKNYYTLTEDNLFNGIENVVRNTGLMGRWQILAKDPLIVCDTGHNREGLESVLNQLKRIVKANLHFVIGFVSEKDLSIILPLFPVNATYYFTKASVPRALDEKILSEEASKYGLYGDSFPKVKEALIAARSKALGEDVIFIGGSTFVVADIL